MIQLNDYSPEHIQALSARYAEEIRKHSDWLSSADEPGARCELLDSLTREWRVKGILDSALARPKEDVYRSFRRSIEACLELFTLAAAPSYSNPVALVTGVHLALIIHDRQLAAQLASLRTYEAAVFKEGSFTAEAAVMGYIAAMIAFVRGQLSEAQAAGASAAKASQMKGGAVFAAQAAALIAVIERSPERFHGALSSVLTWHEKEATRGRLRDKPEGLLCVSALALCRLAAASGMDITLRSPYVPFSES